MILGDPRADSGDEDKLTAGGKKFDKQKYELTFARRIFPAPFDFVFAPTIYPWVSEDGQAFDTTGHCYRLRNEADLCCSRIPFNFPAETDVIEEDGLEKEGNDHCLLKTRFYLKVIISDVCQKHTTEPG